MKILPVNNKFNNNVSFEKKIVIKSSTMRNTLMGMAFLGLFTTDCVMRCSDYNDYKQKVDSLIELKKESGLNPIQRESLLEYFLSKSNIYDEKLAKVKDVEYKIRYVPNMGVSGYKDNNHNLRVSTLFYDRATCLRVRELEDNRFVSKNKFFKIVEEENGDYLINFTDPKNKIKETRYYFANGNLKTQKDLENERIEKRKALAKVFVDTLKNYKVFEDYDKEILTNLAYKMELSDLLIHNNEDKYNLEFKMSDKVYSLDLEKLKQKKSFVGILSEKFAKEKVEPRLIKIEFINENDSSKIKISSINIDSKSPYDEYNPRLKDLEISKSKEKQIKEFN